MKPEPWRPDIMWTLAGIVAALCVGYGLGWGTRRGIDKQLKSMREAGF